MRIFSSLTLLALSAASTFAIPPVPRKAPEFTFVEPGNKQTLLSSFKGKVVMMMCISTTCPHCQQLAKEVVKLNTEFGPRGFQPIAVAFNKEANALTVPRFVADFGVNFPVAFSPTDPVLGFLGISIMENYVYPEVVIIDRKGTIVAQSPAQGDANLQDPAKLRPMLDKLLKEGIAAAPATVSKKAATPTK